jgi:ferric-dicitrate binding protein FerR (iron transport regulator)
MNKELLQRYIEGRASTDEIELVVAWLDADEANVRELHALHKLYDISLFNADAIGVLPKRLSSGKLRWLIEALKIAAVFAIAWASIRFVQRSETAGLPLEWQTLVVPTGQRAELLLPDSTRVWVNSQSRLTYPVSFGQSLREVRLEGEAFFRVSADSMKPFVVKTLPADIEVKGTEFNVATGVTVYPELNVALLKGSVELKLNNGGGAYLVRPNEQVQLVDGKLYASQIRDFDYFRWKEGLLCFNNETVGAIFNKLQLYYDVSLDVRRIDLLNRRYTGKFRTKDGVEQVLKVLQLENRFTYTKDNERNLITIK